ncbi:hypothetical protein D9M69_450670 [compost metagenome]
MRADQFAHLVDHGLALLVPGLDRAAQQAALHAAGGLRQFAVAADEGAGEVGAAGDVAPPDVFLGFGFRDGGELARAPTLSVLGQRRPRRPQRPHPRQIATRRQVHPRLQAVREKCRAGAEEGHAKVGREAPEGGPVGPVFRAAWVAVVEHAGGAVEQAAGLGVPHHPAGGAVPVVTLAPAVGRVAAAHVVVQGLERQRDDHGAAVAVHDGLGQAGGAAAVDDPQRVIEGQPQWLETGGGRVVARGGGAERGAGLGGFQRAVHRGRVIGQVGVQDHVTHRGQGGAQFGHHAQAVEILHAVGHAVAGDQRHRFDLLEAVEHGVGPHVGRAHAPHGADAHHREKGNHGLGDVGQVGGHAVAGLHALGLQVQRERRDLAAQLGPTQFDMAALFVAAHDGREARGMGRQHVAQGLLRVVELRAREPLRPRHHVALQHRRVRRG